MSNSKFFQDWQPREIERQLLAIPRYLQMISVSKLIIGAIAIALLGVVILLPLLHKDESAIRIAFNQIPEATQTEQPRMLNPRFDSVDSDNQLYTIRAKEAVQQDSETVQLVEMNADIALKDGAWIAVEAKQGVLQLKKKRLYLQGDIQIFTNEGNEVRTEETYIDLATGNAVGRYEVAAQGPMGSIRADSFRIANRGEGLTFVGNVKLVLYP